MSVGINGTFSKGTRSGVSSNFGSTSAGRSYDETSYATPEIDPSWEDQLEQARLNRTGFYRKMLASRNRPPEDCFLSKRSSSISGSCPVRESSISDTTVHGSVVKIPEPHSSWRFYTSYDNGEWKRHAVPVHKEEEEILKEPAKKERRERQTEWSGTPPVESTMRKMRQNGGPLLACLQPRPRRSSENESESKQLVHVNGQIPAGFGDAGEGQMLVYGPGDVVYYYNDAGELVPVGEEPPMKGSVKQEYSSKYSSTVTVTQPNAGRKAIQSSSEVGSGGPGGQAEVQGGQAEGSGGRKRRPRIYGFQEKIIIPTKYKTAENSEQGKGVATETKPKEERKEKREILGKQSTSVEREVKMRSGDERSTAVEKNLRELNRTVVPRDAVRVQPLRSDRSQGQTVKVIIVNSGSDPETDKGSNMEERVVSRTSVTEESSDNPDGVVQHPMKQLQDGFLSMDEFKVLAENFHKQHSFAGSSATDKDATDEGKSPSNPQRTFWTTEEKAFSGVGPDGSKRDEKVSQTYEVLTTTNGNNSVQDKVMSPTVKQIQVIHETNPSPQPVTRPVPNPSPQPVTKPVSPQPVTKPVLTKTEEQKAKDIFEESGSLFKTITARPRSARDNQRGFQQRDGQVQKKDEGIVVQKDDGRSGGTSTSISSGFAVGGAVGKSEESVSEVTRRVLIENQSSFPGVSGVCEGSGKDTSGSLKPESEKTSASLQHAIRIIPVKEEGQTQRKSPANDIDSGDWEIQVAVKD